MLMLHSGRGQEDEMSMAGRWLPSLHELDLSR